MNFPKGRLSLSAEWLFAFVVFTFGILAEARSESVTLTGEVREFLSNPGFRVTPWSVEGNLSLENAKEQSSPQSSERSLSPPSALDVGPEWKQLKSADFNGDGCSDLLLLRTREKSPVVLLSDCREKFFKPQEVQGTSAGGKFEVVPLLIDRDDCADLLFVANEEVVRLRSTCDGRFTEQVSEGRWPIHFPNPHLPVISAPVGRGRDPKLLVPHPESEITFLFAPTRTDSPPGVLYLPRDHLVVGSGDFRTDLPGTVLVVGGTYGDFKAFPAPEDGRNAPPLPLWQATFPLGYSWNTAFIGDFNGDTLSDVLAYGGSIAGWWLAQSNGSTGLESPAKLPWSGHDSGVLFEAGDFDGDGYFELLRCARRIASASIKEPRCAIARLDRGNPVSGTQILIDGEVKTETSSVGHFELQLALEQLVNGTRIEIRSGGHQLNPVSSRTVQTRLGRRLTHFAKRPSSRMRVMENFLTVSESSLQSSIGAPVHYVPLPSGPKICLGYSPDASLLDSKWGPRHAGCPANSVWLSSNDSDTTNSRRLHFYDAYCCPLPDDDILGEETVETETMCPEDFVAVGAISSCENCALRLQCRKLNLERYKLGEVQAGVYFGQGASSRWQEHILDVKEIPPAIRFGVRRQSDQTFSRDGCIAPVDGSVYVGNSSGNACRAYKYRQIQYIGHAGDPPKNTPVRMIPECRFVPNPRSPVAGCTPKESVFLK